MPFSTDLSHGSVPILILLVLTGGFVQLANDYQDKGVQLVGISSNSVDVKPMDGPAEMATDAQEQGATDCIRA